MSHNPFVNHSSIYLPPEVLHSLRLLMPNAITAQEYGSSFGEDAEIQMPMYDMMCWRAGLVALGVNGSHVQAWAQAENQLYLVVGEEYPTNFYNSLPENMNRYKGPGAEFMAIANGPPKPERAPKQVKAAPAPMPSKKGKKVPFQTKRMAKPAQPSKPQWVACGGAMVLISAKGISVAPVSLIEPEALRCLVGDATPVRVGSLGKSFAFDPDTLLKQHDFSNNPDETHLLESLRGKFAVCRGDDDGKLKGLPINHAASQFLLRHDVHQSPVAERDFVVGTIVVFIGDVAAHV